MSLNVDPAADPVETLAWDSEFFNLRIGRVREHRLHAQGMQTVLESCAAKKLECVYFLVDTDDSQTSRLAEDNGFHCVDIRLTLERSIRGYQPSFPASGQVHVRSWIEADLPALTQIAGSSYRLSRFYSDPCFSRQKCDELYETWIEKSCRGYADLVLTAEHDGAPAGFITGHLREAGKTGEIGLLGLHEAARGLGVGTQLVQAALIWFARQGAASCQVVTQGRNVAAQRLYQRCGFLSSSVQLWYHWWFQG